MVCKHIPAAWSWLILAFSIMVLAACGGGSSDGGGGGVNLNPPVVRSSAPAPDASPVAVTATPMVTFSEAMDSSSLTALTFSLNVGAVTVPGTVTVTVTPQGAMATFKPLAPLVPNTRYTATVSSGVKDLSGTPLQTSYSWSFKTETLPSWTGARQRGTAAADSAKGVALDSAGNVYLAGSTLSDLDGNISAGGEDLFLIKHDAVGTWQWTRQFGSVASDTANAVAVDGADNIYVAGVTLGSLPGGAGNSGGNDLFLIKYGADGTRLWVRQLGSTGSDEARGVAVDAGGNVYVAGSTLASLDSNISAGGEDLFLVKYDAAGTRQWTRQFGTADSDAANAVAVDATGNVYVAGFTGRILPGATTGNSGGNDLFLIKYGADGTRLWVRQLGSASADEARAVAVDAGGNVYVAGSTLGTLPNNTSAGGEDLFLIKYDTSGTRLWTRQLGTTGTDTALGVGVEAKGGAYVTGATGFSTFGLDGNLSAGGEDIFLVKYDTLGNKQWTRQLGTRANEQGRAAAVDRGGNAFVGGGSNGALTTAANAGGEDLFLVKYDTTGTRQ